MGIGERIKEMRMQKKITQSELADRLGVPYQSIGQWERSVRNPKIETLQKIAEALDVDINWLMHGKTLEQRDQAMKDYVARRFEETSKYKDIEKLLNQKSNQAVVMYRGEKNGQEFIELDEEKLKRILNTLDVPEKEEQPPKEMVIINKGKPGQEKIEVSEEDFQAVKDFLKILKNRKK